MSGCNPNKVPSKLPWICMKSQHACLAHHILSLLNSLVSLMFIAINTQPLIAQPVNAVARFMTIANSKLCMLAKGVLCYLKGVKSWKIMWCAAHVQFPLYLARFKLIYMQVGQTSYRNANALSASLISATMQCSAGDLLCLLYLLCHLQKLN